MRVRSWWALVAVIAVPSLAGLVFVLLPAFGYFPVLGGDVLSLAPWRELALQPGLFASLLATLVSAFVATPMALMLALFLAARIAPDGRVRRGLPRGAAALLSWLLATPHAAFAIGLAFLLAPSGWLVRLAALLVPVERPPDFLLLRDPLGLSLAIGLILKETPFLFFAALAALRQLSPGALLHLGASLGYAPGIAWIKLVAPRLYRLLRLPLYAALAYGLSAVDMALVLGPSTPPTLAVLALDLTRDPDLARRFPAAALAVAHLGLVLLTLAAWRGLEVLVAHLLRPMLADGRREPAALGHGLAWLAEAGALLSLLLALLAIVALPVWSVAIAWRFPDAWPDCCSLSSWSRALDGLLWPLRDSLSIAMAVGGAALIAAILWLTLEPRPAPGPGRRAIGALTIGRLVVALPLLVSDLALLMGIQILLLGLGILGGWLPVALTHFLFVFPYVLLALAGPWARLDPRYERTARCLGASSLRTLLRVRLPLLLPAIAFAAALGFAVSLSLYLPTVLTSGGRVATLATEAIALSAGGDRRITGVYGAAQAALIWLGFLLAWLAARRHRGPVLS
ncbi:MAG TPA: ABC transporter permease subunit [Dongiaceae bacterium]|nr:ABC transporter permease subunit [Dongiaceae bacterium]